MQLSAGGRAPGTAAAAIAIAEEIGTGGIGIGIGIGAAGHPPAIAAIGAAATLEGVTEKTAEGARGAGAGTDETAEGARGAGSAPPTRSPPPSLPLTKVPWLLPLLAQQPLAAPLGGLPE